MKIEQLIVQYLYSNKQVTLQGIGTITLDPSVAIPAANDKDKGFEMPENAFQFEYNLKAEEDEGLVNYIVQHTRKILPLASSDLESYVMLAKQFINIGKPLVIDGVGTIHKNQHGNYQFTPGLFITPKIDEYPKQVKENRDETVTFESEGSVNNSRRNLQIAVVVLVIILSGLGIYYVLMNKDSNQTEQLTPMEAMVDTSVKTIIDTTAIVAAPPVSIDSSSFIIVLKNYTSAAAADKAYQKFSTYGHKLVVLQVDSFLFQLAMPFKSPLSDTLRARDSLRSFFGGNPYVKY